MSSLPPENGSDKPFSFQVFTQDEPRVVAKNPYGRFYQPRNKKGQKTLGTAFLLTPGDGTMVLEQYYGQPSIIFTPIKPVQSTFDNLAASKTSNDSHNGSKKIAEENAAASKKKDTEENSNQNHTTGTRTPKKSINTFATSPATPRAVAKATGVDSFITPNGSRIPLPFNMKNRDGERLVTMRQTKITLNGQRKYICFASPERPMGAEEVLLKRYKKAAAVAAAIAAEVVTTAPATTATVATVPVTTAGAATAAAAAVTATAAATIVGNKKNRGKRAAANLEKAMKRNSRARIKEGETIQVNPVKRQRIGLKSTKTVMGCSAKIATEVEIEQKEKLIAELAKKIATESQYQTERLEHIMKLKGQIDMLKTQSPYAENLHLNGVGVTPEEYDPQEVENIGVSGAPANTAMMVPETVATHYAGKLRGEGQGVFIRGSFEMLPGDTVLPSHSAAGSTIIDFINYNVTLKPAEQTELIFSHRIKAFSAPSQAVWPSTTDVANTQLIANALLDNEQSSRKLRLELK